MEKKDGECIAFPTDTILMSDPGFKPHFEAFKRDQAAFFEAYKVSHKKLAELGSQFSPPQGIFIDPVAKMQADLLTAKGLVEQLAKDISCAPILVRLAWHDSGTYDKSNASKPWPNAGGAVGSIRTDHEINAGPNAGLKKALTQYLEPIKQQVPGVSWADLIQLASATGIEAAGGPKIPMKYGRLDGIPTDLQPAPFGLPDVCLNQDPGAHLRFVFYKYGMDDKDIVALSGAHTLGRAFADRSGTVKESSMNGTAYTKRGCPFLANSKTVGGRSWTKEWTKFDNTYFTDMAKEDADCIAFPTDRILMTDAAFKPHFDAFAKDQNAFFEAYKVSHKKLSELGSKFYPEGGISI